MALFQISVQWFVQNPRAATTLLYIMGLASVLVYPYFELRDAR